MNDNPYQAPQPLKPDPHAAGSTAGAISGAAPTLEYDNTIDDFAALSKLYIQATPGVAHRITLLRWLMPLVVLMLFWLLYLRHDSMIGLGIAAAFSVLWVLMWPSYVYLRNARRVRSVYRRGRNRGLLGKHRLTLKGYALEEVNEGGFSVRQTDTIERVLSSPEHVAIFVSAVSAFVVPVARVSEGNVSEFLAALRLACPPHVAFVEIGK